MKNKINIICGTTASGKTKYAVEVAKWLDAEIINADSMQIYKEFPILSAQPTSEEKQNVPHHLYGILSCTKQCDVAYWVKNVTQKIKEIQQRKKSVILVGGTGMYIKSLISGVTPMPNIPTPIRQKVADLIPTEAREYFDSEKADLYEIKYPVLEYPKKINSLSLEKTPNYKGKLMGIKGQYLIFADGTVFNIRSFEGYKVAINI